MLAFLAAAGCSKSAEMSMQRNRIFLLGRLLAGTACDVRLIWRAPGGVLPARVTADLRQIGGEAAQEMTTSDNITWRWAGQVVPQLQGEQIITITAEISLLQKRREQKKFRVFDTDKAIAIQAGYGLPCTALMADGTVLEWNFDNGTMYPTPSGLTDITAIAAGERALQRLALKTDGTVLAWGCDTLPEDDEGQCDVPPGLSDVVAIAAATHYSLALKADGTVVKWGGASLPIPAEVTDVVAIASGGYSVGDFALKADGTVLAWWAEGGINPGIRLFDVISIAAGGYFLLAVHADGRITQKRLDYSAYRYSSPPAPFRVRTLPAVTAASGELSSIALLRDGSVVVWNCDQESGPWFSFVFKRFSNIVAVGAVATYPYYLALTEDGTVISWQEHFFVNEPDYRPVPERLR